MPPATSSPAYIRHRSRRLGRTLGRARLLTILQPNASVQGVTRQHAHAIRDPVLPAQARNATRRHRVSRSRTDF